MFWSATGCEDRSYREIGAQINALTKPGGGSVDDAISQLARMGRRTLPQIENALHTASPRGKSNLIRALDAIGDPEAAAIVQHFAVYDASAEVRAAISRIRESPITIQLASGAIRGSASALSTISGPTPAGSPMVSAMVGSWSMGWGM